MSVYIGLSLGHRDVPEADHWLLHELTHPVRMACTHLVRTPFPHVAISLEAQFPMESTYPEAATELEARRSGRAVIYPGVERLVGAMRVEELLAASAIEQVAVLGGGFVRPETIVETRDFVCPQWTDGQLTLVTTPAGPGVVAPFEISNPHECCARHR